MKQRLKDRMFSFRLDAESEARLDMLARNTERSRGAVIRFLLKQASGEKETAEGAQVWKAWSPTAAVQPAREERCG